MEFNDVDRVAIQTILANPDQYVVCVDNDSITVHHKTLEDYYHSFSEFGQYFIEQLLRFFSIEAEQA